MRRLFITACSTVLAFSTVSCSQNAQSDTQDDRVTAAPVFNKTVIYICGKTQVKANFYDGFVDIGVNGQSYNLPRVAAASGQKYERKADTDSVIFWSKADSATMVINGQVYPNCKAKDNAIR
ncbi:MliC family protein [Fretibacter rubidus]|uniref:MliC family protein n=1 Tax=Fretibacter rubidus TaxID=570162 RepID=UPI003529D6E2